MRAPRRPRSVAALPRAPLAVGLGGLGEPEHRPAAVRKQLLVAAGGARRERRDEPRVVRVELEHLERAPEDAHGLAGMAVDRGLRERRRRERGRAEDAAVLEQQLERASERDVEHPHDEVHPGVELLGGERGADVPDIVVLEQRERRGLPDPGAAQRRLAAKVGEDRPHARIDGVAGERTVSVACDHDDVLAERGQLLDDANRQPV